MKNEEKNEKIENGINLKEFSKDLIVREFERSLEHKKDVEAKAANYMLAVTLILTILTTFMVEIKKNCDLQLLSYIIFNLAYNTLCAWYSIADYFFVYVETP